MNKKISPKEIEIPKANLIDRGICKISPTWGARRQQARYDMAVKDAQIDFYNQSIKALSPSRGLQDISSQVTGTDYDIQFTDRNRMINTSYRLFYENPLFTGIILRIVNNLMGHTGIWPVAFTNDDKFNQDADNYFAQWGLSKSCDLTNRFDYIELQYLICLQMLMDGDVGSLYHFNPSWFGGYKLSIVDSARIATPWNRMGYEHNKIFNGVQINSSGAPIYYFIGHRDQNWYMDPAKFRIVRAVNMEHTFIPSSYSAYRGVTPFLSTFPYLRHFADNMDYELIKTKMQAVFGLIYNKASTSKNPVSGSIGQVQEQTDKMRDPDNIRTLTPGMIMTIGKDDKLEAFNSSIQGTEYAAAAEIIGKVIAAGAGIPWHYIIMDFSKSNYYGQRLAADQFTKRISNIYKAISSTTQGHYSHVITHGIETGALKLPSDGSLDSPFKHLQAYFPEPEFIAVDPEKETNTQIKRQNNGMSTIKEYLIRRNRDYRKVFAQRGKEIKLAIAENMPVPVGDPGTTTMQEIDEQTDNKKDSK